MSSALRRRFNTVVLPLPATADEEISIVSRRVAELGVALALPEVPAAAEEIRRVAKKGCHAITFPDNPKGLGYPSLHDAYWEPIWQAASETGTILCIHIGSGTGMSLQDTRAPVEIMITSTPITLFNCATELVFSDALQKFPDLKVALSEGGIGWIPYFLERIDYVHQHHHPKPGRWSGSLMPRLDSEAAMAR